MKKLLPFLLLILTIACKHHQTNTDSLHPQLLTCELRENPLGIDLPKPRLAWKLFSKQRNERQTAYRILVATNKDMLERNEADLWDSDKVPSDKSVWVNYNGKPLKANTTCYWKVQVWDVEDNASDWSSVSFWSMGLLSPAEWQARWIGIDRPLGNDILTGPADKTEHATRAAARYLRKEVRLTKVVKTAFAYICGLGAYELYINGTRAGDYILAPNASEYSKQVYFNTYDVTSLFKQGRNALGVILGNGRWLPPRYNSSQDSAIYGWPKLILQIEIDFTDGSHQTLTSNDSWHITADGPITANNEYDGEDYNALKEMPGWNQPAFNDNKWLKAELVKAPEGYLLSQINEPMRVTQTLKPASVKVSGKGVYIVDIGQNIQGWLRVKLNGKRGNVITLKYAETLKSDGSLYTANLRTAKATDNYTLKGEGVEIYEPTFTLHGFRYVEISGYTGILDINDIEGRVVHDDVATTGSFECSDSIINQIYSNITWGTRTNYRSFPTDCPQRDERMGWLGDRAGGSLGEAYMFDIAKLYSKWLTDMRVSQRDSGSLSDVIPTYWPFYNENVTWEGTYIMCLENMFAVYGDSNLIKTNYPAARKWVFHMHKYLKNGLINRDTYGDWCVPPEKAELIHSMDPNRITGGELLATSYFYYIHTLMHRFAIISGNYADTALYTAKANEIKAAFNKNLFDADQKCYGNNSATSNILPLAFEMVDEKDKNAVFEHIVFKLMGEFGGHVCTGLIGQQRIMRVLSDFGRPDLAFKMATNTTYPSWGYMAKNGATTIWELWNGNTADPAMNSGNHVMLVGDLAVWLYQYLGGIRCISTGPGFKQFNLKPVVAGNLSYAKASFNSVYGLISSHWQIVADTFVWDISIPVNTQATIYVPAGNANKVFEGNKHAAEAEGLTYLGFNNGYAQYKAGSGVYSFKSTGFTRFSEKEFVPSPQILPADTMVLQPDSVKITITTLPGNTVYYTTNGQTPTQLSEKYSHPFYLKSYANIKAIAISGSNVQSYSTSAFIDVANKKTNGLNFKYYEGTWTQLPNYAELKPKLKGTTLNISTKLKKRNDYFGIVFSGFINLPISGKYQFTTTSDDGSRLIIDGKTLVDNDGVHSLDSKSATCELNSGRHTIEIQYFDGNFGDEIKLMVKGPGIAQQNLPVSWLYVE